MIAKRKRNLRLRRRGSCARLGHSIDSYIVHPILPVFYIELPELVPCPKKARTLRFLNLRFNNCAFTTLVLFRHLCSAVLVDRRVCATNKCVSHVTLLAVRMKLATSDFLWKAAICCAIDFV